MHLNNEVKQYGNFLALGSICKILTLNLEIWSKVGDNALKLHDFYSKNA